MTYNFIATWKMAFEGVKIGEEILKKGGSIEEALENAICNVENNPNFRSVGFGGLPNINGDVELDAAYMDGKTMGFGGIMAAKNIKNPIKVAISLSKKKRNIILASKGAEHYAESNGFEFQNMLTTETKIKWLEKITLGFEKEKIEAYGGHDTVCMIGTDCHKNIAVGVSTSGLFMKHPGRVGDSPIIGSGFYCSSKIGGAAATGVGEDIMKGCLSYEIVRKMSEGLSPQESCEKALKEHLENFKSANHDSGSMSVIAINKNGDYGAATTKKEFPFVIANEKNETKILVAHNDGEKIKIIEPDEQWFLTYVGD